MPDKGMIRTFRYRLLPNATQRVAFEHILADSCETYNAALQERTEAWKLQRKSISLFDQTAELTELRKDPRFRTVAADIQREPLRRVDRAFKAFYRRCKAGEKPGYPRYRSRARYSSFATGSNNPTIGKRSIRIPGVGDIRIKLSRPVLGTPKKIAVRRAGNRWTAYITCDIGPAPERVSVSSAIGIDVGLTALATLSNGDVIKNPRWTRKYEARIAAANRALAHKQRRSRNRLRAKEVLRRAHQRAADARRNYIHHVSKWLVATYDLIAFEKLNIAGMVRGNLAKSIHDAAWAELIWQITYKAESAGKWAIPVNPRGTSIRCSRCGADVRKTLADRQHICACGVSLGRDHNAALNVLALGMSAVAVRAESQGATS